jgi:glycosyltransferase involved in cell wall biosynthesis
LDKPYIRKWTQEINKYANNYNSFDVSLAPLVDTEFNSNKSQLKVIEAGFYKKALIASNVGPYTIDLKHALNQGQFTDGNALLVDNARNHSDWSKNIKKLVENPNMIVDLGERLYETVKDKYDLNQVTKTRYEFYKSLIK